MASNPCNAHHVKRQGKFRFEIPLDCAFLDWSCSRFVITDEYIVAEFTGDSKDLMNLGQDEKRSSRSLFLFDRWTFQLVSALTVLCTSMKNLHLIEDGIHALFFNCELKQEKSSRSFLWHPTTGKLHALPSPDPYHDAFCIGKLIVQSYRTGVNEEKCLATVYKVNPEADGAVACIVNSEPLRGFRDVYQILSAEDLHFFVITNRLDPSSDSVFQLRSKEDFTLLRTITDASGHLPLRTDNSFVFNECFAFVFHEKWEYVIDYVDVVSLVDGNLKTVYRFPRPKKMPREYVSKAHVATVGRFLVLYYDAIHFDGWTAAIWKLPLDFVETCHRHLQEGTVGMKSQCDQLIAKEDLCPDPFVEKTKFRIDRFGILKCSAKWNSKRAVVRAAMLKSIVSGEEDLPNDEQDSDSSNKRKRYV